MEIGIDLGGTKIAFALIDENNNLIKKTILETAIHKGKDYMIKQIKDQINLFSQEHTISGIGFAIPGLFKDTTILETPNVPILNGVDLANELELNIPLVLENDGNCFTLAENRIGAGRNTNNMIGFTIGTGLGAGIIINKELYNGSNGKAGEISNTIFDIESDSIIFGAKEGTWDSILKGKSILKRHNKRGGNLEKTSEIWYTNNEMTEKTLKETAKLLAIFCHNTIRIFDPETIIIGGGASHPKLIKETNNALESFKMQPILKISSLGDNAGLFGAVLALREFINSSQSF